LRPRRLFTLLGLGLALFATEVRAQAPDDPYEQINRRFYASQSDVDRKYLLPAARMYHRLTPGPIGVAIHNMLTELSEPVVIINDVLQLRLRAASRDLVRLTANGTFGLAATIDVATKRGFPHHSNDFGITLGVWGAKPGPYLYLPFVGPTTVRDLVGVAADVGMNPLNFVRFPGRRTLEVTSGVVGGLDKRLYAQADLEAITADATDPYATLRSVYLQSREAEIRGESATPILPPIDEPAPTIAPPVGPSALAAPQSPAAASGQLAVRDPVAAPAAERTALADLDAPIATAQPVDLDRSAIRLAAAN
jgi:phospholipid-binding lipoprotein MlaA